MQLNGLSADGELRTTSAGVIVLAADTGSEPDSTDPDSTETELIANPTEGAASETLPETGVGAASLAAVGLFALLLGAVLLTGGARQRRTKPAPHS